MSEFFSADEVMQKSIHSMGDEFYTRYLRESIITNWAKIVGEINASKIKPLRIEYKKLFVYVNDSTWKANLYAYKSTFIEKINAYAKENIIEDIILSNPKEKFNKNISNIVLTPKLASKNIANELKKVVLTDEELEEIDKICERFEDDDLRETMKKTSISRLRLKKYRLKNNWHKCKNCDSLCPENQNLCDICQRKEIENFRSRVAKIFREVPWSSYSDIYDEIKKNMPHMLNECLPQIVESIRSSLIQRTANSINLNDKNRVSFLVMLYTRMPAEKLNEQIISKTLYKLRYDLPSDVVDFKAMNWKRTSPNSKSNEEK